MKCNHCLFDPTHLERENEFLRSAKRFTDTPEYVEAMKILAALEKDRDYWKGQSERWQSEFCKMVEIRDSLLNAK